MFFSRTMGWERLIRFSAHSTMEKVTGLRLSFPLSTFDISRMSLISVSRWLPARLILCRLSRTVLLSSTFFSAMAVSPMMAFMGVRMSCDMVERKSVLAWLARSASAAATFSCRFSRTSHMMLNASRAKRPAEMITMRIQSMAVRPSWLMGIMVTRIQWSVELTRVCAARHRWPWALLSSSVPGLPETDCFTSSI